MDKYEHRRLRLLELRTWECEGKTARLAEKIARSDSYVARMLYEEGRKDKKRIGDDMIDVLVAAFALRPEWFSLPLGTPVLHPDDEQAAHAAEVGGTAPAPVSMALRRPTFHWPFQNATYQRITDLKSALGPKRGMEAMHDIDALLDIAVSKWEREAESKKRQAGGQ
jgi:hypothetical protein